MLNSLPKGLGVHVETKLILEAENKGGKAYRTSFACAFSAEEINLAAVNAQVELPISYYKEDILKVIGEYLAALADFKRFHPRCA